MIEHSKQPWFIVDICIFIVLNSILLSYFWLRLPRLLDLPALHFVLLALATYRGAHIISNEVVSQPLRAPFTREVKEHGKTVEKPLRYGFRGAFGSLLYCPSCSGTWIAAALVYLYLANPHLALAIAIIVSLSAVERIVTAGIGYLQQ